MTAGLKDPLSGRMMKRKSITTAVDKDPCRYESCTIIPDGSELKSMEMAATRKQLPGPFRG